MSDLKLGNKTGNIFAEHGEVNRCYSAVAVQVGCGFNHINLISRNILAHESQVDSRYLAVAIQVAEHYSAESAFRALAFLIKRVFGFVFYKAAGTLIPVMGLVKSLPECVRRLVLFLVANAAFEPVICLVMLLLVAVSYASCITTSIACRIASVVKDMCCNILLIAADFAFKPVICIVVLLFVIVSYRSCITTGVAGRIAGVVEDVSCDVFLFAA